MDLVDDFLEKILRPIILTSHKFSHSGAPGISQLSFHGFVDKGAHGHRKPDKCRWNNMIQMKVCFFLFQITCVTGVHAVIMPHVYQQGMLHFIVIA